MGGVEVEVKRRKGGLVNDGGDVPDPGQQNTYHPHRPIGSHTLGGGQGFLSENVTLLKLIDRE